MPELFQNKYKIGSNRLKGYNYSQNGYYFITICTKDREHYFGNVIDGKMVLNEFGEIAQKYWLEIPNHFPFVLLDEFKIMPNHMHGVLIIDNNRDCRDAPRRVSTGILECGCITQFQNGLTRKFWPLQKNSISSVVNHFKGNVTKGCHKINQDFSWQPRFYDHIIRNEQELNRIRQYIIDNPKKWGNDRNNKIDLWI